MIWQVTWSRREPRGRVGGDPSQCGWGANTKQADRALYIAKLSNEFDLEISDSHRLDIFPIYFPDGKCKDPTSWFQTRHQATLGPQSGLERPARASSPVPKPHMHMSTPQRRERGKQPPHLDLWQSGQAAWRWRCGTHVGGAPGGENHRRAGARKSGSKGTFFTDSHENKVKGMKTI